MACSISFDIGTTSELYSQLTGVLAGFSFTAVIIAVSRSLEPRAIATNPSQADSVKASLEKAMPVMICSFLGLVITSLTYSAIAGDANNVGRATIEELIGGLAFAVAGILMFYSIVLLLEAIGMTDTADHGRRVLGQFVTLVSFAYICNGIDDYNDAHFTGSHNPPVWEIALTYSLLGSFALYALLGYLLYHKLPRMGGRDVRRTTGGTLVRDGLPVDRADHTEPEHHKKVQKIATTSLLFVIACALGVGFFSAYGNTPCATVPVGVAVAIMCVSFTIALAFSVWFFLSRGPDLERT
ncbi:hypothetical protein ACFXAW_30310 [Streptomyces sp. NPDC059445]|uniref:hypothetical protein n=1 Tax=Streptomyces sp. NPDC059445 TaxID=3346832 RepID=UPI0036BD3527